MTRIGISTCRHIWSVLLVVVTLGCAQAPQYDLIHPSWGGAGVFAVLGTRTWMEASTVSAEYDRRSATVIVPNTPLPL